MALRSICNFSRLLRLPFGNCNRLLVGEKGGKLDVNSLKLSVVIPKCFFTKPSHHIPVIGETLHDTSEEAEGIAKDVLLRVNNQIKNKTHSRLFAIVLICGVEHKITTEDVIALSAYFPADIGERIRLEKVLLVGSSDFTLVGRPLLSPDLIRVEATVLEKTFSHAMPLLRFLPRRRYKRLHWLRPPFVLLRINSINFVNSLDEIPAVEGLNDRIIY